MAKTLILRAGTPGFEKEDYRIPKTKAEQFPIEATIGRARNCYVKIVREGVSRNHATIYLDEIGVRIRDNNSMNGTYVNGERVRPEEEAFLRDKDSLWLGLACPLEIRIYEGFLGGITKLLGL